MDDEKTFHLRNRIFTLEDRIEALEAENDRMRPVIAALIEREDAREAYLALRDGGNQARYMRDSEAAVDRELTAEAILEEALMVYRATT